MFFLNSIILQPILSSHSEICFQELISDDFGLFDFVCSIHVITYTVKDRLTS